MAPHMGTRASNSSSSSTTPGGSRKLSTVSSRGGGGSNSRGGGGGGGGTPATTPGGGAATAKVSPFPPLVAKTMALFAEFDKMKSVKNYLKFGEGLSQTVELTPLKSDTKTLQQEEDDEEDDEEEDEEDQEEGILVLDAEGGGATQTRKKKKKKKHKTDADDAPLLITRNGKETTTARRLLINLQWYLATRWLTTQQAIQLLSCWPSAFDATRMDVVCVVFDRVTDLHHFNGILSCLSEFEAAQCLYRIGWLNLWSPLVVDNYYELHLAEYEEREIAKALVRLAIDEPGENWQRETFGWSREELIPGWELNLSWLKDGGFPEKGYLCLEYYSGADKGCGPVWPTRRELACGTLCGLPSDDVLQQLELHVDSMCMMKRARTSSTTSTSAAVVE